MFFSSEKAETDKFKDVVVHRKTSRYYPSFKPAEMVGISGRALGKITSNFTVIMSDHQKNNLGLSLKYEAKALKVIDYSGKEGRNWDYSEKAIELPREYKSKFQPSFVALMVMGMVCAITVFSVGLSCQRIFIGMMKATDALPGPDPDGQVKEIRSCLKSKGLRDFEAVSLYCDQLIRETTAEIEALADGKSPGSIKKAIVKSISRQAVLRPSHVAYRLQNQHFALGGSRNNGSRFREASMPSQWMCKDVVWDVGLPFMSGVSWEIGLFDSRTR
ncbi:hypothetical protein BYT27DRAFT_7210614 [Phlegmacium glaucopus]|nr:hypothetical protein BYT27DRAFT_7210614 [Phlegmacium glaucopus]